MSGVIRRCLPDISQVIVYKGHEKNPLFGPYADSIKKLITMFKNLNPYREANGKRTWTVISIAGEELVDRLKEANPEETLLIMPAGQTSRLDAVFTVAETTFLKDEFFSKGGRGYFTCGAAYWASSKRIYRDLCEGQSEKIQPTVKTSKLSLFDGTSEGPLCPYPGHENKVGFYHDAVRLNDGENECTIYLSGGGSCILEEGAQKVKVLVRYLHSELFRLGKEKEEVRKWENAAIMASVGKGAVLLSMFHPYYGAGDIDVELYERVFSNCGTNWREVKDKLSPLDVRMKFVYKMVCQLEEMDVETSR